MILSIFFFRLSININLNNQALLFRNIKNYPFIINRDTIYRVYRIKNNNIEYHFIRNICITFWATNFFYGSFLKIIFLLTQIKKSLEITFIEFDDII